MNWTDTTPIMFDADAKPVQEALFAAPDKCGTPDMFDTADRGTCADCALPLVPGVDEEADQLRAIGFDGKPRYFCGASADALHHPAQ